MSLLRTLELLVSSDWLMRIDLLWMQYEFQNADRCIPSTGDRSTNTVVWHFLSVATLGTASKNGIQAKKHFSHRDVKINASDLKCGS